MKIKHHELSIPQENPFINCKLRREPFARVLTDIVGNYADGFVLAINNEWGTGKTTFVKMWEQQLKNESFQTIYFNAWENDFDDSPLIALIAELKTLIKDNSTKKRIYKSVLKKGAVLLKNAVPALVKSVAKKHLDTEELIEGLEDVAGDLSSLFEKRINDYTEKKDSIKGFREELSRFTKDSKSHKSIIFIIDELDRCRPNYAVQVLEQVKHLFTVEGIVFVLSIDKKHLISSIKGYYGSDMIDGDEYLRRFIDLEYSIPNPSISEFVSYLYNYYDFKQFLNSPDRMQFPAFQNDGNLLVKMAQLLFEKSKPTLRQQERIFAHTRIVFRSFGANQYTFSYLVFVLVFIKILKPELYIKIKERSLSPQEFINSFADLFDEKIIFTNLSGINLSYCEALFLRFYHNQFEKGTTKPLITTNGEKKECNISSKLNPSTDNLNLIQYLERIDNEWDYSDVKLSYLLNKIDLLETLN